jgi:heme oxygenase
MMQSPRSVPGIAHARLRSETSALHRLLDSRIGLADFASRPNYIKFLLMNWPGVAIEAGLAQAGIAEVLPDWGLRQRRQALENDLAALGTPLPPPGECIIEPGLGSLLGWSYVLEGSRLGARAILCGLSRNAGTDTRDAMQFLRHGEGNRFWPSFKKALSRIDDDPIQIGNACGAANAAYALFVAAGDFTRPPDRREEKLTIDTLTCHTS